MEIAPDRSMGAVLVRAFLFFCAGFIAAYALAFLVFGIWRRNGGAPIALNNGRAALDFVFRHGDFASRQNGHLLVLLDINMPGGLDGVEVLRQIKLDPEKRKILVIMLTTTDDPREVDACYALGCNVYMTKPIDPSQFMEALTRLGLFLSVVSVPEEKQTA